MNKHISYLLVLSILLSSCGQKTEETQPIRKDVTETIFASGTLEAEGSYELTAQTDGYLKQINFDENDLIGAGQILALIENEQNQLNAQSSQVLYDMAKSSFSPNSPQLSQARNSVEMVKQKMTQDSVTVNRYKPLAEANAIAKVEYEKALLAYQNTKIEYKNAIEQYEQLRVQAKQQLVINESQKNINQSLSSYNQIKAVKSGKVYKKLKQAGDFVRRGEAIALIGDASQIYARVNIDEKSMAKIHVGQEAIVQLNLNTEQQYKGKVAEILPTFDEATQSFIAKIAFTDDLSFSIIKTQLQANILIGTTKNALLIPRKYLNYEGEVLLKGETKPKKIVTKIVSSDWVQVVSGLAPKSTIVIQNP